MEKIIKIFEIMINRIFNVTELLACFYEILIFHNEDLANCFS